MLHTEYVLELGYWHAGMQFISVKSWELLL